MYIRGNIGFRPIEESDLEILRALHNEMSTLLQLGNIDLASRSEQLAWWKSLANSPRAKRYTLVDVEKDRIIGLLRVLNIEEGNRNCEVGLDIVPDLRGHGYGKASYETALEYIFQHWNMHMVYLKVGDFNDRARSLYKSLGFEDTGHFKEYLYRHGRYWDYLVMCMTRDAYLKHRDLPG
jgi:RimJ/RimL family protein N-acetyltransferase